ncbi:hypothetical protein [Mucilaginibacter paludis]|uniref:Uncharacterized protein n=1 Tax=Mucilaginibacter paludis DSM 18603 TaxID=714943 RepID=H1XZV9_9SPHI|nr:hypothetical protein [Mucilaginibacter paludis]EHQ27801.1 hypothetical protein Mucpa_3703 [Mucilaginibacter paludis DSM 18603]
MNWKLIFQLSLLGLIMAFGTISLIPDYAEPFFWLPIFVICAYLIAKVCATKYFAHGFFVSVLNSVWLTASHTIFYPSYAAHHPEMIKMMPMKEHIVLAMIVTGILSGILFGLVQGLFAFIASRIVKKNVAA